MTLGRLATWILNATLGVLCCYTAAGLVTAWAGEWMADDPIVRPPATVAVATPGREWSDRRVILDRNLFRVSTLLPVQPVAAPAEPADEKLQATRLPLRLLGTVASIEADAGVGISVGFAELEPGDTADGLAERADAAMLGVKAAHHAGLKRTLRAH